MTFQRLAQALSVFFALAVVITGVLVASAVIASYSKTEELVVEISLEKRKLVVAEEDLEDQETALKSLEDSVAPTRVRCEAELTQLESDVEGSCQDLARLEARILGLSAEVTAAELVVESRSADVALKRAEVDAEVAYQRRVLSDALLAGALGIAISGAFALAALWRKESTGWKK